MSGLADLESMIGNARDSVSVAAIIADTATTLERAGLLAYAVYEADLKLAALHAEYHRLLDARMPANDNWPPDGGQQNARVMRA